MNSLADLGNVNGWLEKATCGYLQSNAENWTIFIHFLVLCLVPSGAAVHGASHCHCQHYAAALNRATCDPLKKHNASPAQPRTNVYLLTFPGMDVKPHASRWNHCECTGEPEHCTLHSELVHGHVRDGWLWNALLYRSSVRYFIAMRIFTSVLLRGQWLGQRVAWPCWLWRLEFAGTVWTAMTFMSCWSKMPLVGSALTIPFW